MAARASTGTWVATANSFNPAVTGTTIVAGDFNSILDEIEVEITDALSRSGKGGMLANLDMSNNNVINVARASAAHHAVRFDQIIVAPASSTDNAVARFDGVTGKLLQNSGVTIDDSSNIVVPGTGSFGAAGGANGRVDLTGSTSGVVTVRTQAVAGTYNFNLPTAAGTSGQPLLSGGGGAAAQTYGTLGPAGGGTGIASYAVGDLLYASGATTLAQLADVATGNALISGGVGVAPAWGKIGLTTHVSGTLPVANGGTNVISASDTAATIFSRAVGTGSSGSTNDSSSGSGAFTNHTPTISIPASYITTGRGLRILLWLRFTTGSAAPSLDLRIRLGGTTVAQIGTNAPANNLATKTYGMEFVLMGLAAAGASANTETMLVGSSNGFANQILFNSVSQPVALATNGALTLDFGSQWNSAGTGTNTLTLMGITVEGIN
jgi:hypothetical protein